MLLELQNSSDEERHKLRIADCYFCAYFIVIVAIYGVMIFVKLNSMPLEE